MSNDFSDAPRSVTQLFPAASWCCSTGSSFAFDANHSRASSQVSVHATRCAPFSSPVRARSSFNSATVRFGFRLMKSWLAESRLALQHLTATALPDKFTVTYLDFAPYGHDGWAPAMCISPQPLEVVVVCCGLA